MVRSVAYGWTGGGAGVWLLAKGEAEAGAEEVIEAEGKAVQKDRDIKKSSIFHLNCK
jgi:hypothetical protein